VWEKRVLRENKKRAGKAKGLLEEFDYEFNAPAVKSVDSVPKQIAAVEDAPAQAQLTAEVSHFEAITQTPILTFYL
jgi:nucleolar protein 15